MLSTYSQVLRIIEKEEVENKSNKKEAKSKSRKKNWRIKAIFKKKKRKIEKQKENLSG